MNMYKSELFWGSELLWGLVCLTMLALGGRPLFVADLNTSQVYVAGFFFGLFCTWGIPRWSKIRENKRIQTIMHDELLRQAIDNRDEPMVDISDLVKAALEKKTEKEKSEA